MAGSPLAGYTVLDLASVGPAARTSRWLADFGADVVKIGPTPRHGAAQVTPWFFAYSGHRDMQRVQLDLKEPAGRDAFLRLAASADVVIESFRPGVVDRLGIGYDDVREVNPGIVYCSTTGFGQTGPYAKYAGHDLGYLAVGGFLDCSGRDAAGGPAIPGATVADSAAGGMHAVMSILAALLHRTATDEGAYLDVAVADGRRVPRDRRGPGAAPWRADRAVRLVRRVRLRRRQVGRGRGDRATLLRQPLSGARLRAVARPPVRRCSAGPDARRLPRGVRLA
jgi:crotonobetainyl-CoA:carnitine CoA-transferase CaiB-like acyl-CoA transferase